MGMDLTGASGNYFRANCWSWRPIVALVERINAEHGLGHDLHSWHYNDGAGLKSESDCIKLADLIEQKAKKGPDVYYLQTDRISMDANGRLLPEGQKGFTPYSTDVEHLLQFVDFLRKCGGSFEIW